MNIMSKVIELNPIGFTINGKNNASGIDDFASAITSNDKFTVIVNGELSMAQRAFLFVMLGLCCAEFVGGFRWRIIRLMLNFTSRIM